MPQRDDILGRDATDFSCDSSKRRWRNKAECKTIWDAMHNELSRLDFTGSTRPSNERLLISFDKKTRFFMQISGSFSSVKDFNQQDYWQLMHEQFIIIYYLTKPLTSFRETCL